MTSRLRAVPLLALLAAGCAHGARPEITRPLSEGRCDDALSALLARPPPRPPGDGVRRSVATPLSWLAVGAGYTADVTALVSASVVGGLLVCAPVMAIEGGLGGGGDLSAECFQEVSGAIFGGGRLPGAGAGLANATRGWRCPDLRRQAAETLAVSECLIERAAPGDLEAARAWLRPLTEPDVERCLPRRQQRALDAAYRAMQRPRAAPEGDPQPLQ